MGQYEEMIKQQEEIMKQQEEMLKKMSETMDISAMQEAMFAGMGGHEGMAAMASMAMKQGDMFQDMLDLDEDEEFSDEDIQTFIDAHPAPSGMQKYLMIGALLIGTNGEPYTTLALMEDKEYYAEELEDGWEIESRADGLDMLQSLMEGRHSAQFAEDYAVLRQHGIDGYFENSETPLFDEDSLENYDAAIVGLTEVLEMPEKIACSCTSLYGWDLDRVGFLARILCHVGYITEIEAYEWMQKAGKAAAKTFSSWDAYFVSILLGRALHLGTAHEPFAVASDLLTDSHVLLEQYPIDCLA